MDLDIGKAIERDLFVLERKKAWIKTYTGLHFHGFDPKPDQICLLDIAHPLSRKGRFMDHVEEFLTIGQHCINCYELGKRMGFDKRVLGHIVLHDGAESYAQDIATPFKAFLPEYKEFENIIQDAIYNKYFEKPLSKEEYLQTVKYVDRIMLVHEINQLKPDDEYFMMPDVNADDYPFDVIGSIVGYKETKRRMLEIFEELGIHD